MSVTINRSQFEMLLKALDQTTGPHRNPSRGEQPEPEGEEKEASEFDVFASK